MGTTVACCVQLSRLEYIHSRQLVYRDVKPENFVVGRRKLRKDQTIYVVDFGLAKEYVLSGEHIAHRLERNITGTVRYVSINTHQGAGRSSVALLFLFLFRCPYIFCGGSVAKWLACCWTQA